MASKEIVPQAEEVLSQSGEGKKSDVDVALDLYIQAQGLDHASKEKEAAVLRKIDLHLQPLLMVTGFLQYLDKQAVQYAFLYNFQKDLHLTSHQLSWTGSFFYVGYLVFLSGAISFLLAAASNFGGVVVLRLLLGAAESIQLPFMLITSNMYYTRKEQPFRMMLWYMQKGVAQVAGALFAYGVGHIDSQIPRWKYIFIISILHKPGYSTRERERQIAVMRVKDNQTGIESKTCKWKQAWEALTDPKGFLNAIAGGCGNILGGVGTFAGLLIKSFGFTTLQSTLLQLPVGVIECIGLVVVSFIATNVKNSRMIISIMVALTSLTGSVLLYAYDLKHKSVLLTGFWMMVGMIPCGFITGVGTMTANVGGHTKRITAQALFFVFYSAGNITAPQFYTESPYFEGRRANVVALVVVVVINILILFYYIWENRQRRKYLEANRDALDEKDFAFRDLTDKENPFCFNVW
ncbi:uncharacterized protein Z520_10875 [Fonsecaea multimorphosa CBS 102226]|uniref:Major facilitator superfamily (MFS) profile domain-containing protein n=1 Tax=Fonsecaea multimorphosa CBS 102226 TaxID=1442371 RepID=A0A0D2GV79_9EURO|nr:uncharacterized protein Z520_10875 [Fonsecaea multimorphosa CBS 102226]KIX93455.1 hypothetical protein Z520_10875 [Fonsecaea multimorphosa CBS 102226]OAL18752.1 hypothetical protein AYO22_10446 [Fonsecaea multimorphosa]